MADNRRSCGSTVKIRKKRIKKGKLSRDYISAISAPEQKLRAKGREGNVVRIFHLLVMAPTNAEPVQPATKAKRKAAAKKGKRDKFK